MEDSEFKAALTGQLDGMAQAYLVLAATLRAQGAIDLQQLQANLRRRAVQLPEGRTGLADTHQVLAGLADELLHMHCHGRRTVQSAAHRV